MSFPNAPARTTGRTLLNRPRTLLPQTPAALPRPQPATPSRPPTGTPVPPGQRFPGDRFPDRRGDRFPDDRRDDDRFPGRRGDDHRFPDRRGIGAITTGSGLTVDGRFVDDHSRIRFHLGHPIVFRNGRVGHVFPFRQRIRPFTGFWWYGYDYGYPEPYVYGTGSPYVDPYVYPPPAPAQAQPQPEPPPRELAPIEKAQAAAIGGDVVEAVRWYREHLRTHPDDAAAMRLLAVALMDAMYFEEATAMVAMAYDKEPTLAATPLDAAAIGALDANDLRQRVLRAVTYANRVETSSSWLLVAVLMQAEGRDSVARQMIDRAKARGLEPRVVQEFEAALRR